MSSDGTCPTNVLNVNSLQAVLNVLAVNICGIECYGRLDQIQILLVKHLVSVAVLTETETSHSIAESTNTEGFKAFCPPACVTRPLGGEVGVILMISNRMSSAHSIVAKRNAFLKITFKIFASVALS